MVGFFAAIANSRPSTDGSATNASLPNKYCWRQRPGKASAGQLRLKHSAQGAAATARQLTSHLRRWSGCTAAANHSTVADRAVEVAFRIFAVPMLAVGMAAVT